MAIENVPSNYRNYSLYVRAVNNNGISLQYIGLDDMGKLTEDQYLSLCIEAVENNTLALKYVQDAFQIQVINHFSPEYLIAENYGVYDLLIEKGYQQEIENKLRTVKHVIITLNGFIVDKEVNDSRKVYANSPKRQGQVIHANKMQLNELLTELNQKDVKNINLVLLSHAVSSTDNMVGLSADELTNILSKYNNINRVTLLGCQSVRSYQLEQEKDMIESYNKKNNLSYSGITISTEKPNEVKLRQYFDKLKNQVKRESYGCIFVYVPEKKPTLFIFDLDSQKQIIEQSYELKNEQLKVIANIIGKNGKIPSPTKKQPVVFQRFISDNILGYESTCDMIDALSQKDRFSRGNINYQQTSKKHYPFLTGVTISSADEIEKIKDSFLKKVIEAISNEPKIKRNIAVKGYNEPLYVDAKECQMITSSTNLYTHKYNNTFFNKNSSEDIISRAKLDKDRRDKVKKMINISSDKSKDTMLKSITVNTHIPMMPQDPTFRL